MRKSLLILFVCALVGVFAQGCSDDDSGTSTDTGTDSDTGAADTGSDDTGSNDTGQIDTGTDTDPPEQCGDLTFQGECNGDTVRWCQDEAVETIDCSGFYPEGVTGSCGFISTDFGFFCMVALGDECIFSTDDDVLVAYCAGNEPACIFDGDETTCQADFGACAEGDDYTCSGNVLIEECNSTQPTGTDCAASGGTCDDSGDSATCIDLAEDSICDDETFFCADGLTCEGATAEEYGACTGGGGGDEGDGGDDAGDMGEDVDDDSGDDDSGDDDSGDDDSGDDDDTGDDDDVSDDVDDDASDALQNE